MNLMQFFAILRARWIVAVSVLVLTVVATLVVSLLLPKQYTASASVVIDSKPDPISAMAGLQGANPAFLATQVDIIESERVAQRVVRNLRLNENPQIRAQWMEATGGEGSLETWLGGNFQSNMEVKPSRESNVITISYKSPDPRFAAGLANAFAQAYIDTALELRVDPAKQFSTFFDTRAKAARETLEKAQSKVSAFQAEKGIIATEERLDIENARLNELNSQLVMLQAVSAESSSRQAQVGTSADRLQEVLNNPVIAGLKADVSRQEARLSELRSRLGDANPQVIDLRANISELRNRIAAETSRVGGSVGVTNQINRSREAQVKAELDIQRQKVLSMKAVRDEGAVLLRDVENAQRSYDTLLARLNQTSLESLTTQSNANVLTQATPPLRHSTPRVGFNTLIAVFGGTLLAVGVALGIEMIDRRLRGPADAVTTLGLPVIGVIPKPNAKRLSRNGLALMHQRSVGRLAAPAKGV